MDLLAEHRELKVAPGNRSLRPDTRVKPWSRWPSWTDCSHVTAMPTASPSFSSSET